MTAQAFEISSLEDLERVTASVGLVGPRTGPDKRTKEQMEWYVLRRFLEKAIPTGIFGLPLAIRRGPPKEPDFVLMHGGTTNAIGLVEITEATDEANQREMTASEQSGKATLLGGFGGRFSGGASWSGFVWASDIIKAIKRKSGKVIFESSPTARHLLIYPNSNASILLFNEEDEGKAIGNLYEAIAEEAVALAETTNGCLVHVVGKYHVYIDLIAPSKPCPG
jgi:hypothetical protein